MPHTALRIVPAVQPIRRKLLLLRVELLILHLPLAVRLILHPLPAVLPILHPPLAVLPAVLLIPTRSKSLNFIHKVRHIGSLSVCLCCKELRKSVYIDWRKPR